jgi:hypothetical protein
MVSTRMVSVDGRKAKVVKRMAGSAALAARRGADRVASTAVDSRMAKAASRQLQQTIKDINRPSDLGVELVSTLCSAVNWAETSTAHYSFGYCPELSGGMLTIDPLGTPTIDQSFICL